MSRQGLLLSVASVICLPVLTAGCVEVPVSGSDAGDVEDGGDARVSDASPADAGVDARPPRPDATVYDFCDQAVFKLPIDGMTEITNGIDIWGGRLAYSKYKTIDENQMNVFLFDVAACTEWQLTHQPKVRASAPSLWASMVTWSENRQPPTNPYHCQDLYSYDLEMWQEIQLSNDPLCEWQPKTNGRHLAYTRNTTDETYAPADFRLRDLETDEEIVLAPAWGQVGYFDISDRYVVWSQYRGVTSSKGRDIVYYDLEAGEMGWVEQSAEHYTYWVATSGEHLIYVSSEVYDWEPFSLHLFNVSTRDATVLAPDDPTFPGGFMHDHLVTWISGAYTGPENPSDIDVVIHDIRSGISRRLTRQSSYWFGVAGVHFPYLILARGLGISSSNNTDYYVANLVELGVTDLFGNLIPGDPVLDPPPDGP